MRMFEQVVERQQPPQHDLRRGGPAMPDVLDPEHPIDPPRRDPAEPEPRAVPRLLDRVLTAPSDEAVRERRIGPADEGEVLRAEEHAAVQADERQPLRLAAGPAVRHQRSRPIVEMSDHQPASRAPRLCRVMRRRRMRPNLPCILFNSLYNNNLQLHMQSLPLIVSLVRN